jgi:hypothetical protein
VVHKTYIWRKPSAVKQFIAKFGHLTQGVLSGFDRLVIRGTLRAVGYEGGMSRYLTRCGVLLKDFKAHVEQVSQRLKAAVIASAVEVERYKYLYSSRTDKEEIARQFLAEHGITSGLICTLGVVEPCWSFQIHRNADTHQLELESATRKCLHLYQYQIHPEFGFCHARIQTWFPFAIQICLNGREWAARTMDREGLRYHRAENCFPWVEDFAKAQEIMEGQLKMNWPRLLDQVGHTMNPLLGELFDGFPVHYYWSVHQSEWATDVSFRSAAELKRLVPMFLQHATVNLRTEQILYFLGRKRPGNSEVSTDLRRREEGWRVKHRVDDNSIKQYDKAYTTVGSVLRAAETTINDPSDFRVYRPKEGDRGGELAWRPLRKGIADLHRRARVSQRANERYVESFAVVDDTTRIKEFTADLERPVRWKGQRVRALHPFSPDDSALLEAVARGEFLMNGLRNRDLQELLFSTPASSADERRRRSAFVSRKLRLLRAHRLLGKVGHRNRYHVTAMGRSAISAILSAQEASVKSLAKAA